MRSSSGPGRQNASLRLLTIFSTFALQIAAYVAPEQYSPFSNPLLDRDYERADNIGIAQLEKRQGCPVSYGSCQTVGNAGVCCPNNNICSLDQASHVACCPIGATCTGTIRPSITGSTGPQTGPTTTSGGVVVVGATTTATSSGGIVLTTAQPTGAGGVTTVPNAPYPFVFIPTTYSDQAACSSYYTDCQRQYASCTAALGGNAGNAVTISGVTGLVTVGGATATVGALQAPSVCSSLSQTACYGLRPSDCAAFASGGGSFVAGQTGAAAPRFTGCPGAMYAMGAGVALGVAGGFV